ncbi:hypothetical protein ACLQ2Q_21785 [Microbacterium sp. DT81.1]|uniref:hypothetical protein n=1 Tax=Microbacterium sp. DT81.1 TaxID=3393413 RepID=UPI003CEE55D4
MSWFDRGSLEVDVLDRQLLTVKTHSVGATGPDLNDLSVLDRGNTDTRHSPMDDKQLTPSTIARLNTVSTEGTVNVAVPPSTVGGPTPNARASSAKVSDSPARSHLGSSTAERSRMAI